VSIVVRFIYVEFRSLIVLYTLSPKIFFAKSPEPSVAMQSVIFPAISESRSKLLIKVSKIIKIFTFKFCL